MDGGVAGVVSGIPADWINIGVLVVLLVLVAMYAGVVNMVALALGALVATALLPLLANSAFFAGFAAQLGDQAKQPFVFLGLFLPLFLMIRWMSRDTFEDVGAIQAILAGIAATIVIIVMWQQMPGLASLRDFGPTVDALFSPKYQLWWLLGALLALTFAKK